MQSKITSNSDVLRSNKPRYSTYKPSYQKRSNLSVEYRLNEEDDIVQKNIFLKDPPTYLLIPKARRKILVRKNRYTLEFKRIFDVIFSVGIITFVLSWLYPILYIIIKLDSPGPVLFKQQRTGLNGVPFYCFKFRSMRLNNQSESLPTSKNDNRVTKIGSFLRKNSIDEIPQFINVLFGEMTVVGPRPHMLNETKTFNEKIHEFSLRHQVKPGITGLAQVNGYRGKIDKLSDLKNRLRCDLVYIERASLIYDLKIIHSTVMNMLFGDEMAF